MNSGPNSGFLWVMNGTVGNFYFPSFSFLGDDRVGVIYISEFSPMNMFYFCQEESQFYEKSAITSCR